MFTQISDPGVQVNNVAVGIVPNTLEFTEGFGEQNVKVQSAGGGILQQVFENNVETNIGMVKFSLFATIDNIEQARQWKANGNLNVVTVTAVADGKTFTRTFTNAAIVNDYSAQLQADGVIELEFKADRPSI